MRDWETRVRRAGNGGGIGGGVLQGLEMQEFWIYFFGL